MALPLITAGLGLLRTVVNRRAEVKQAKHNQKIRRIDADQNVALARISDMSTSLKDEYLTIIISLPFLSVFWYSLTNDPEGIERVKAAFVAMDELPEWYRWAFLGVIAGVFGLRGLDRFMK